MGFFSGNAKSAAPATTQIEQRSHESLNLSGTTPEIAQTLDKISEITSSIKVQEIPLQGDALDSTIAEFVHAKPNNLFIIDGERHIKQSIICTDNTDGGKTCLKLKANSIELFKTMQKLEYFCSLPDDIDATYFECRKIQ